MGFRIVAGDSTAPPVNLCDVAPLPLTGAYPAIRRQRRD
jgi:hypothetical protein